MPRKPKSTPAAPNPGDAIASIKYPAKRKNLPPAGLEAQGVLQEAPRLRYEYNPHLPPMLRSATDAAEADKLPELLATARQRALTEAKASLARREDLAGKVQMIYLDPPYGIKFASNFQPQLGQRDVKDREQDLTREPEMVRACRDTSKNFDRIDRQMRPACASCSVGNAAHLMQPKPHVRAIERPHSVY